MDAKAILLAAIALVQDEQGAAMWIESKKPSGEGFSGSNTIDFRRGGRPLSG
jgi:hypothetical protein